MTHVNYQRINLKQASKLASFLRQLALIYVVLRLPKGTAHSCTTAQLLIRPDLFINQPWTTNSPLQVNIRKHDFFLDERPYI